MTMDVLFMFWAHLCTLLSDMNFDIGALVLVTTCTYVTKSIIGALVLVTTNVAISIIGVPVLVIQIYKDKLKVINIT